ncbi:MAG TPA: hypothetical protein VNS09_02645 [Solirubrobacter sp.]|nr:hypothetical protein [Solirubrobacter sp.]
MPSLQLDVAAELSVERKQALAREMSAAYSRIMGSDPRLMTVVIRTLPAGSVWHGTGDEPVPGALLMCDVRAGRDRATRHDLAASMVDLVAARTGVAAIDVKVEFTQHSGDEMFHPFLGGFNRDWDATEAAPDER